MSNLLLDIKQQSDWSVRAFRSDGFKLGGSMASFIEIDRIFEANMNLGEPKPHGRLSAPGYGAVLFSIGAYLGETIAKHAVGSHRITDDDDPMGEVEATLVLPDGGKIWPIERVIKRF
ncbi:MAG: hypothetical protein EAY75_17065 [Bacteroidetes bacterium]|nr:MAG: hypothetical protein EAY75_17065 [Bacteroidota bacterium]